MDILKTFNQGMSFEVEQLNAVLHSFGNEINQIVEVINACKGKVIITGVGKSAHIGKKISASLSSTGTPSCFMHATEAVHGDLGLVTKNDVVILITNSGETKEVLAVLPSLKKIGVPLIGITKSKDSSLAKACDYSINYDYQSEADHLKLAPTVSTLIVLAIGDALATTLSELKHFTKEQFHLYHPGGSLGKQLEKK